MEIPLEQLAIDTMASGNLSLILTDAISWEQFPEYAATIARILGAALETRADTSIERVWELSLNGLKYWIAFNDFGLGVSLDSQNVEASAAIPRIREELDRWRSEHTT